MATVPAPMRLHRGPRGTEFGGARLHDPTCHVYACLGPADQGALRACSREFARRFDTAVRNEVFVPLAVSLTHCTSLQEPGASWAPENASGDAAGHTCR